MNGRALLLERLDRSVRELVDCANRLSDPDHRVNTEWSAKETLGHLVFWHESFARNVRDLAIGVPPTVLKGRYSELNRQCLDQMRAETVGSLIQRLTNAQGLIRQHILDPRVSLIPYRRGSRDYTPEEHLTVVHDHIQHHLRQLRTACAAG